MQLYEIVEQFWLNHTEANIEKLFTALLEIADEAHQKLTKEKANFSADEFLLLVVEGVQNRLPLSSLNLIVDKFDLTLISNLNPITDERSYADDQVYKIVTGMIGLSYVLEREIQPQQQQLLQLQKNLTDECNKCQQDLLSEIYSIIAKEFPHVISYYRKNSTIQEKLDKTKDKKIAIAMAIANDSRMDLGNSVYTSMGVKSISRFHPNWIKNQTNTPTQQSHPKLHEAISQYQLIVNLQNKLARSQGSVFGKLDELNRGSRLNNFGEIYKGLNAFKTEFKKNQKIFDNSHEPAIVRFIRKVRDLLSNVFKVKLSFWKPASQLYKESISEKLAQADKMIFCQ